MGGEFGDRFILFGAIGNENLGWIVEEPSEVICGSKESDREGADSGKIRDANIEIATEEKEEAEEGTERRESVSG